MDAVRSACRRIPPLWSLQNFVAVNPFLGLSDRSFAEASGLVRRVGHGDMLMSAVYYLQQVDAGRIDEAGVQRALALTRRTLPSEAIGRLRCSGLADLKAALSRTRSSPEMESGWIRTFADTVDVALGSEWAGFVVEEVSKWCSAYYDQGQSSWRMPWRGRPLFAAWKEAAQLDANPELNGLRGFRSGVRRLPQSHVECIHLAVEKLGVPEALLVDWLHRQLMSIAGWSSHVQFLVREKSMAGEEDDTLVQLLAVRLAYELALFDQFGGNPEIHAAWRRQVDASARETEDVPDDLLTRFLAQQALECGYQARLFDQVCSHASANAPSADGTAPPALQAVFCIDVRSEVFRRALETRSDGIETIGFAGFFGMPIEYLKFDRTSGGARCPALLSPAIRIREIPRAAAARREDRLRSRLHLKRVMGETWNSFKSSAISCFSFVETAGMWFGLRLVKDSLLMSGSEPAFAGAGGHRSFGPQTDRAVMPEPRGCGVVETGMDLDEQITLAAGALKNMGLTSRFARIVLVCGHGSATKNNPYGSALDCGACGGHAGDVNARVAAAILNKPEVRAGLQRRGIQIPEETLFLAGLHNTTTDEVLLYDREVPLGDREKELDRLRAWLSAASRLAREERAESLGLGHLTGDRLDKAVFRRGRDWAQVRPEWGLAGNAAFIAAPRRRTRGLKLGGRTFLHDYDASQDPDHSVLTLIMTAPMVVASWINLQYYGSTVNNRLFGSGDKTIHNVLGTFGVWQGNGGDLQTGLPLQSVHNGTRWAHEPLRLTVVIEAGCEAIESVLAAQPGVRELVQNGWVNLFALTDGGTKVFRYVETRFEEELQGARDL